MKTRENKVVEFEKGVKEAWFWDECYRANVHIVWPCTPEVLQRFMKKRFNTDYKEDQVFSGRAIEIEDAELTSGGQVIALSHWENTPKWIACLAHEVYHVTNWILWRRGLKCVPESEEAFCYLYESILRRSLKLLRKK
jgi:hypothetical protein